MNPKETFLLLYSISNNFFKSIFSNFSLMEFAIFLRIIFLIKLWSNRNFHIYLINGLSAVISILSYLKSNLSILKNNWLFSEISEITKFIKKFSISIPIRPSSSMAKFLIFTFESAEKEITGKEKKYYLSLII